MKKINLLIIFFLLIFNGCSSCGEKQSQSESMLLESNSIVNGADFPVKYTCEGDDISLPVKWSKAPQGTKSFVFILDDPDAPVGTFNHWLVYDIPSSVLGFSEGFPEKSQYSQIKEGNNDFGTPGYRGPCPPEGVGFHRYYLRIYAVDIETLGLPSGVSRSDIDEKISGHILGETNIFAKFKRD